MSDLVEQLKDVISDRAGGSTSEPNYDPQLLDIGFTAADRIERLEAVLVQAREALKVFELWEDHQDPATMATDAIAAIDAALKE